MELKKVEAAYKDIVLPGGGANEEFLAALREKLKGMEEGGCQGVLVCPLFGAEDCKDTDAALEITAAYKHCARRIKDCQAVKGFEIPAAFKGMDRADEIIENFKSELLEKHPHYVFE